jgi:hypothetical protein
MAGTKRTFEFIAESRVSNENCKKKTNMFKHSVFELNDAIYYEEKELEQIEQRNDLDGHSIEELAYPIIRLRSIQAKLEKAVEHLREFISTREDQIDEFEDKFITDVQHAQDAAQSPAIQCAQEAVNEDDESDVKTA